MKAWEATQNLVGLGELLGERTQDGHGNRHEATDDPLATGASRGIMADKEQGMGDKGGKKDKEKVKQQQLQKQKQETQRKQDKAKPRIP